MTDQFNTQERMQQAAWLWEALLPGLFTLILLSCLTHLVYSALQAQLQPVAGFHYAISAFGM